MQLRHLSLVLVPALLLAGCTTSRPQRRVLVSTHPNEHSNIAVTLASFPSDLRAFAIMRRVDPQTVRKLEELHKAILAAHDDKARQKRVQEFNLYFEAHVVQVLVPEAPARVVVSQKELSPSLEVTKEVAGGKASLTMTQETTKLGNMPDNELKAYLAYLAYLQNINGGADQNFQNFLLRLVNTSTCTPTNQPPTPPE